MVLRLTRASFVESWTATSLLIAVYVQLDVAIAVDGITARDDFQGNALLVALILDRLYQIEPGELSGKRAVGGIEADTASLPAADVADQLGGRLLDKGFHTILLPLHSPFTVAIEALSFLGRPALLELQVIRELIEEFPVFGNPVLHPGREQEPGSVLWYVDCQERLLAGLDFSSHLARWIIIDLHLVRDPQDDPVAVSVSAAVTSVTVVTTFAWASLLMAVTRSG